VRRFHQFQYAAESWAREETVIARVEATGLGTDARFIVTNLNGRGKHLYEKVYCQRGTAENLIKDMKLSTRSDKTACSRWQANQFRLFLHMGAYWLLHSLRMAAPTVAAPGSIALSVRCERNSQGRSPDNNSASRITSTANGGNCTRTPSPLLVRPRG
jgi:Transposase DDE domain group 1